MGLEQILLIPGVDAVGRPALPVVWESEPVVWEDQQVFWARSTSRRLSPLSPPTGFGYTPPFEISRSGFIATTDFDPDDYIVSSVETYYVSPTGDDTDDGLTPSTPKKSIGALITAINAIPPAGATIFLEHGVYLDTDSMVGVQPEFDCNLICNSGRAILLRQQSMTWSKTAGRTNLWESSVSGSPAVVDLSNTDEFGIEVRLRLISGGDLATADSTPNTSTFASNKIYVHTFDGREPDADVVVFGPDGTGWLQTQAISFFARNVHWWGWEQPVLLNHSGGGQYVFDQCSFRYSRGSRNGFETSTASTAGMLVIHNNCDASYNRLDGFGYRGSHVAIEIGCKGVWNGYTGTNANDNGSTTHNSVVSVRVNGVYRYNDDRNLHDINATSNWLICCVAGDAQNASSDPYDNANFLSGRRGQPDATKMFLEGCISTGGSASDVGAYGNSFIETLECLGLIIQDTDSNGFIRDAKSSIWF